MKRFIVILILISSTNILFGKKNKPEFVNGVCTYVGMIPGKIYTDVYTYSDYYNDRRWTPQVFSRPVIKNKWGAPKIFKWDNKTTNVDPFHNYCFYRFAKITIYDGIIDIEFREIGADYEIGADRYATKPKDRWDDEELTFKLEIEGFNVPKDISDVRDLKYSSDSIYSGSITYYIDDQHLNFLSLCPTQKAKDNPYVVEYEFPVGVHQKLDGYIRITPIKRVRKDAQIKILSSKNGLPNAFQISFDDIQFRFKVQRWY